DGAGLEVSHTKRLFGDDTAVADSCQPGKGWLREELGYLAEESRWVSLRQASYDGDGNTVGSLANGVERTIAYDDNGLHPVSESVSPASGQTLAWTASWDNVMGTLTQVTAPNGTSSSMTYDGLGRLTSSRVNGAPPHVYYRYNWFSPKPQTETFAFDG